MPTKDKSGFEGLQRDEYGREDDRRADRFGGGDRQNGELIDERRQAGTSADVDVEASNGYRIVFALILIAVVVAVALSQFRGTDEGSAFFSGIGARASVFFDSLTTKGADAAGADKSGASASDSAKARAAAGAAEAADTAEAIADAWDAVDTADGASLPGETEGAWDGAGIRLPLLSISYDAAEETEFCLYLDYIAECSRDAFLLLDKNGAEVFQKNIEFLKPSLQKRGGYLLVCDIGGRTAFVMKGKKLVWEETFTDGIVNASINQSGYLAIVLEATGYRNSVRVLAPVGKMLFDWVVADDYVVGSEVTPSGKALLINRLKTAGISVFSELEFLDMKSEPFLTLDSDEEQVFLGARCLEDDTLAAVTETVFLLYSGDRELIYEETFDAVMAFCEFPRKKAVLAAQRGGRVFLVEYDPKEAADAKDDKETDSGTDIGADGGDTDDAVGKGVGRALLEAEQPILNMASDGVRLFVNFGDEAIVIKDNGKQPLTLKFRADALYGDLSEKLGLLVVTKKSANLYEF
ncbi:MAG: DUF5711 family protein [Clostridiales bacterium]|jgi:hypothetical protein|nr:DUF5711 family protein [Clostridiales bacterium]